jgi:hypothetical protein
MSDEIDRSLDAILKEVEPSRRKFIKQSLLAGGTIALATASSTILAQTTNPDAGGQDGAAGKGKGKGKGRGKGQGKGRGKGQGKGRGKGQGKGRGKGQGKGSGNPE